MDLLTMLTEAIVAGRPVCLVTVVEAPDRADLLGKRLLTAPDGAVLCDETGDPTLAQAGVEALALQKPGTHRVGTLRVYAEPFLPAFELVVVGAGHVAQPVAQFGKALGFVVTVIDDRPEYANANRFPTADRIICDDFVAALRSLTITPRHHFVLVTRGHRHDMDSLLELVQQEVAYIGMIGSRNRVATVFRLLKEEHGIDPSHFTKMYAPIGLDIGARTPAEIGISVAAELVKVRHGGSGESLSRIVRGGGRK